MNIIEQNWVFENKIGFEQIVSVTVQMSHWMSKNIINCNEMKNKQILHCRNSSIFQ
jgi:hypothetical protein